MNDLTVTFTCDCGKVGEAPRGQDQPWSVAAGYGDQSGVRWHATLGDAFVDEPPIDLLANPPPVGLRCWLRVGMPVTASVGEAIWALYLPPLLYFNGLEEAPELLADVRLVEVMVLGIEHNDDAIAIEVEVRRFFALTDLEALPVQLADSSKLEQAFDFAQAQRFAAGPYDIWEFSIEGDAGGWMICRGTIDAGTEILLLSVWDEHRDYVYAGRGLWRRH
jgi:hypothetical protein